MKTLRTDWTEEMLRLEALKYEKTKTLRTDWTDEDLKLEALKYKTRNALKKGVSK
jgi:hypothetical protein